MLGVRLDMIRYHRVLGCIEFRLGVFRGLLPLAAPPRQRALLARQWPRRPSCCVHCRAEIGCAQHARKNRPPAASAHEWRRSRRRRRRFIGHALDSMPVPSGLIAHTSRRACLPRWGTRHVLYVYVRVAPAARSASSSLTASPTSSLAITNSSGRAPASRCLRRQGLGCGALCRQGTAGLARTWGCFRRLTPAVLAEL